MVGTGNSRRRVLRRFYVMAIILGLFSACFVRRCGVAKVPRETTGEKQETATREKSGKFKPGVSGNPAGRPRGSRDPRTVILAELLDGEGAKIVRRLIDQAKQDQPWAIRLCIERLLPRHEKRVAVEIPKVTDAASVAEAISVVIDLAAEGQLTLEEARGFLILIEQQRKAIETNDLAIRLELIEGELKGGGKWD